MDFSINKYTVSDMNMDGDVSGVDKAIFEVNNGVCSTVGK